MTTNITDYPMRSLSRCWLVGGLVGCLLAMAALGDAAAKTVCRLKAVEMPVTMKGKTAIVTVRINETDVPLVLDTGAFYSSLTVTAAAQLGLRTEALPHNMEVLGLGGKAAARMTRVEHLHFLKHDLPNIEFLVVANEFSGGEMGLLGRNLLAFTDAEYDLAHGAVRLMFPEGDCDEMDFAYWAGDTPVSELELDRDTRGAHFPAITGTVLINGRKARALFDTGATSVLSLGFAYRAGMRREDMTPTTMMSGIDATALPTWHGPVAEVQIGGETVRNSRLRVADFYLNNVEMLVGIEFFLSHRIYVSQGERRMFFTYSGGSVFTSNAVATDATTSAVGSNDKLEGTAPRQ